jgi:hypothetical protein
VLSEEKANVSITGLGSAVLDECVNITSIIPSGGKRERKATALMFCIQCVITRSKKPDMPQSAANQSTEPAVAALMVDGHMNV